MEGKMVWFERVSLFIILIVSVCISCITGYSQEREPDVNYVQHRRGCERDAQMAQVTRTILSMILDVGMVVSSSQQRKFSAPVVSAWTSIQFVLRKAMRMPGRQG